MPGGLAQGVDHRCGIPHTNLNRKPYGRAMESTALDIIAIVLLLLVAGPLLVRQLLGWTDE